MKKMKWGRKKNPQSSTASTTTTITSSPGFSTISQVFPVSWLSKLKQLSVKSKTQTGNTEEKSELFNSLNLCEGDIVDDNDAYWRISFGGDERLDGETYRSAMYNSDNEPPLSNCGSCRNAKEDNQKFTNMVSDIRKMREFRKENQEQGITLETPSWNKVRKGRKVIVSKSRRTEHKCPQEGYSGSGQESNKPKQRRTSNSTELEQAEKKTMDLEPIKTIEDIENGYGSFAASGSRKSLYISSLNSVQRRGRRAVEGAEEFTAMNSESFKRQGLDVEKFEDSDRKAAKESKIKDIMSKSEKQRKLIHQTHRTKQTCKVRAYSPRTASKIEICKIRALQDMKKAKLKNTKGRIRLEIKQDLESYAVVTCSYDPQKDFRDSMLEMIIDNKIRQPAELEELLACYLSLNSEEYHGVIINVFKQVWIDLSLSKLSPILEATNHIYSN
ncbi:hypothetical protein MKX01_010984 [Papaver californicum]|nr:hypothetical protein MKX01_010984 [Papaver californicum]